MSVLGYMWCFLSILKVIISTSPLLHPAKQHSRMMHVFFRARKDCQRRTFSMYKWAQRACNRLGTVDAAHLVCELDVLFVCNWLHYKQIHVENNSESALLHICIIYYLMMCIRSSLFIVNRPLPCGPIRRKNCINHYVY